MESSVAVMDPCYRVPTLLVHLELPDRSFRSVITKANALLVWMLVEKKKEKKNPSAVVPASLWPHLRFNRTYANSTISGNALGLCDWNRVM